LDVAERQGRAQNRDENGGADDDPIVAQFFQGGAGESSNIKGLSLSIEQSTQSPI
jgi:hypothetical protein